MDQEKIVLTNLTSTHETLEEEEDGYDTNWEAEKPAEKKLQLPLKLSPQSQKLLTKIGSQIVKKTPAKQHPVGQTPAVQAQGEKPQKINDFYASKHTLVFLLHTMY